MNNFFQFNKKSEGRSWSTEERFSFVIDTSSIGFILRSRELTLLIGNIDD